MSDNWIKIIDMKRVCELEIGDVFRYMNQTRIVTNIGNGSITHKILNDDGLIKSGTIGEFGINSQARVAFEFNKKSNIINNDLQRPLSEL